MIVCDAMQGHHEAPPYQNDSMRSAYHVRELDVYRLLQLKRPVDVALSHDWPRGIAHHGDTAQLFRAKSFLRREVRFCCQCAGALAMAAWCHWLTALPCRQE